MSIVCAGLVMACLFATATFAYFFCYFLILRRVYKEIDGRLYVKHGLFGEWVDVEQHLEKDHMEQQ